MGLVARSIVTVSLAAAGLCVATAVSASASPAASTTECGPVIGFSEGGTGIPPMQVGTVCVSIGDGQVSGFNGIVPGNTMYLSTWVTQCNAAQTACSIVPGTTVSSLATPSVPTTPGEFYEGCTFYVINNFGNQILASGCSPLVPA